MYRHIFQKNAIMSSASRDALRILTGNHEKQKQQRGIPVFRHGHAVWHQYDRPDCSMYPVWCLAG